MNDYIDKVNQNIAIGKANDAFNDRWSRLCVEKWKRGIHEQLIGNTILSRVQNRMALIDNE